jgi:hypothetical protein
MKPAAIFMCHVLLLVTVNAAFADDRQKAQKQLEKVSAMASDAVGRRIVSAAVAKALEAKRPMLVQERKALNLSYGPLFIEQKLVAGGADSIDILRQLKSGKDIWQVADERSANWKQLAGEAKKLNSSIEDAIYKHFVNSQPDFERDQADNYDPYYDGVMADREISERAIEDARTVFQFWRERAGVGRDSDKRLGIADEKAAAYDHVRSGGPQSQGASGGAVPSAGGIPQ